MRPKFSPIATKRQTFVIDHNRRVLAVIKGEFRMGHHAEAALEVLRGLATD